VAVSRLSRLILVGVQTVCCGNYTVLVTIILPLIQPDTVVVVLLRLLLYWGSIVKLFRHCGASR